jgi:hypothetical protein
MTKRIMLTIASDEEAATLLEDAANYPESSLLTPCQENPVNAAIELDRRHVVVICGSLQYPMDIFEATVAEWQAGHQVHGPSSQPHIGRAEHDRRHREQIDLADEVLIVVKPDGSIGESTMAELAYAVGGGKPIRYWPDSEALRTAADAQRAADRATTAIHQQLDNA